MRFRGDPKKLDRKERINSDIKTNKISEKEKIQPSIQNESSTQLGRKGR